MVSQKPTPKQPTQPAPRPRPTGTSAPVLPLTNPRSQAIGFLVTPSKGRQVFLQENRQAGKKK